MNPVERQFAMKQLGLDPMTGRKLKPKFDVRAKYLMIDKIMRMFAYEIKQLEFEKQDIENMTDRIRGGFKNPRMYFIQYYPKARYNIFIRIFYWIVRELSNYKP